MKGRIEFVKSVEKNVKLRKWKQIILLHEVSDELRLPKIVKCCVEIVIGEKVISNFTVINSLAIEEHNLQHLLPFLFVLVFLMLQLHVQGYYSQ
jgi:hypothetical protein